VCDDVWISRTVCRDDWDAITACFKEHASEAFVECARHEDDVCDGIVWRELFVGEETDEVDALFNEELFGERAEVGFVGAFTCDDEMRVRKLDERPNGLLDAFAFGESACEEEDGSLLRDVQLLFRFAICFGVDIHWVWDDGDAFGWRAQFAEFIAPRIAHRDEAGGLEGGGAEQPHMGIAVKPIEECFDLGKQSLVSPFEHGFVKTFFAVAADAVFSLAVCPLTRKTEEPGAIDGGDPGDVSSACERRDGGDAFAVEGVDDVWGEFRKEARGLAAHLVVHPFQVRKTGEPSKLTDEESGDHDVIENFIDAFAVGDEGENADVVSGVDERSRDVVCAELAPSDDFRVGAAADEEDLHARLLILVPVPPR